MRSGIGGRVFTLRPPAADSILRPDSGSILPLFVLEVVEDDVASVIFGLMLFSQVDPSPFPPRAARGEAHPQDGAPEDARNETPPEVYVAVSRRAHAHDLQRPNEPEPRHRLSGHEVIVGSFYYLPENRAYAKHEHEVDTDYQAIEPRLIRGNLRLRKGQRHDAYLPFRFLARPSHPTVSMNNPRNAFG